MSIILYLNTKIELRKVKSLGTTFNDKATRTFFQHVRGKDL